MSAYGNDMFAFWSSEALCYHLSNSSNTTERCLESSNSTFLFKLNAMNQYDQPPGFELYNSGKINNILIENVYTNLLLLILILEKRKPFELNNTESALEKAIEFLRKHPDHARVEDQGKQNAEIYEKPLQMKHTYKNGGPIFRKTYNRKGLDLEYGTNRDNKLTSDKRIPYYYDDLNQGGENTNAGLLPPLEPADLDYNAYDDSVGYNQNRQTLVDDSRNYKYNSRDPRSKEDINELLPDYFDILTTEKPPTTEKEELKTNEGLLGTDEKYGMYDYQNVRNAKARLLVDLSKVPTDILREEYQNNHKSQIRRSRFEQRDLQPQEDIMNQAPEQDETSTNSALNLWILESEKEFDDKKNGYVRGKRSLIDGDIIFNKITTTGKFITSDYYKCKTVHYKFLYVGVLTKSTDDTIDIIFITYWMPSKKNNEQILEEHLQKCVNDKLFNLQSMC